MPSLRDYESLAPFTIDELVDAANSLTRDRPRLKVSLRTVRFYISRELLPRPLGAPKVARYGMEHLLRVVAYRCMQDSGQSLEESNSAMDLVIHDLPAAIEHVELLLQDRLRRFPPASTPQSLVAQPNLIRQQKHETVTRIRLTPSAVLEISAEVVDRRCLRDAVEALTAQIEQLDDTY